MTTDAAAQARRIAHVLDVEDSKVAFLGKLDAETLRTLHGQIVEVLFDLGNTNLGPLQSAARLLPPAITAAIAQRALGPVICGRLAGTVDASLAVSIARRLPPEFLADVAGHVHPDRVEAVVSCLPLAQVDQATRVLVERGDVIALGHFSGVVCDDTLQSVIAHLDDAALLDVVPFIEPAERTSQLIGMISDPALLSVLWSAHRTRRWPDAFDMVGRLDAPVRTRIASITVPETDLIDGALRAAAEHDRWPQLLSFAVLARAVPAARWGDIAAFDEIEIIDAALSAAERHALWGELTLLVSMWPVGLRRSVAKRVDSGSRVRLGL